MLTCFQIGNQIWPCSRYRRFRDTDYLVSVQGKIINGRTGKEIKPCNNGNDYLVVEIHGEKWYHHRVVSTVFEGEIPEGLHVNHDNYNRKDNRPLNLKQMTPKENQQHRSKRKTWSSQYSPDQITDVPF